MEKSMHYEWELSEDFSEFDAQVSLMLKEI
jgi:hypothetical protein